MQNWQAPVAMLSNLQTTSRIFIILTKTPPQGRPPAVKPPPPSAPKIIIQNAAAATDSISPHTTDIINHGQCDRALHRISTRMNAIPIVKRRISRTIIQAHGSGLLDDEEIQIEVVCRHPRSDFQSLLIQSVESLSLEARYCSFSTLQPQRFMQCVVTAKVYLRSYPYFHCSSFTTDQCCDFEVEKDEKRQNDEDKFFIISGT